jgi:hypothetical protein
MFSITHNSSDPSPSTGNTGSSTFGQVVSANPPRLVPLGAEFFSKR